MKESGLESRPIRKARLKLRVASVARNMPRRRSEKHLIRRRCWCVGGVYCERGIARRLGSARFKTPKRRRALVRFCPVKHLLIFVEFVFWDFDLQLERYC